MRDFSGTVGRTLADSTPSWPSTDHPERPNVLVVLFDDIGFSDFGCYGSEIATPTIDRLAGEGLRYTGFHTTAMCSTTRASLLTGRNHHSVGMGCLANFDSGFPGYRGKIAEDAATIAELLSPHGYRNYMIGKWHATPLTESGPTGPFDGWPLGRGFHRFYGFLDAETDQYSPELVQDNQHITAPGTFASGYHLSEDLIDHAIGYLADHRMAAPDAPWLTWVAFGACHAPHQAPKPLIDHYGAAFAEGWDLTRDRRLARQKEAGVVPENTRLPPRNDHVAAWAEHTEDERTLFARLQGAYAAMLDHADGQLTRLVDFLEETDQLDDTIVLLLSDNGASQEGGPLGFVNAMGPFNGVQETMDDKLDRLDDIGGPDTHSNFPWGWAMAANTPLRRYKQNTHGGGIRDPLVVRWPAAITDPGGTRDQFCHAADVLPTVLDALGIHTPATLEGTSFAPTFGNAAAARRRTPQYFEMFGHRGLWHDGWKAVAYHPPYTPFEEDRWELFNLDEDFSETNDLAAAEPERLRTMIDQWWTEAEQHQVLPLDDRFGERFAENASRRTGHRRCYEFWAGMGHVPSDVAPDLRSRSYTIRAEVDIPATGAEGVLIAHGDATSGYSLFVRDGRLVHDLNIGGHHHLVTSLAPVPTGECTLAFRMQRREGHGVGTLLIDGQPTGSFETDHIFWLMISWSGLDVGLDRGTTVSDYDAPFAFTGTLRRVVVELDDDQDVDHDAAGRTELARE